PQVLPKAWHCAIRDMHGIDPVVVQHIGPTVVIKMRRVVERLLLNLQLERLRSAALRSTSRAASATCCPRPAHPPSTTQSRRSPGAASSMSCSMWPPSLPWRVVTACPRTSRIVYSGNTTSDAAASPRITQAVFETPTNPTSIYSTY